MYTLSINVLILNIQHFNVQVCITMREKNSPAMPSIISAYVMSAAFPVYTYRVYLSTVCVRECAFAGATLRVCPHTCFLTLWALSCGHRSEALWSRSHCFLYDCLMGCFPSTHWLYYVSHIVSDIGRYLCLSLLHSNAALASSCSQCEEAWQGVPITT